MVSIAIVYFSGQGHTKLMAEALAEGVTSTGGEAQLLRITGEQIANGRWKDDAMLATLGAADGIAFGSPTYMGGIAGQFKCFLDAASATWFQQGWKDKIAGGFTHSGSPNGDKQGTLLYLAINAAQHGMIWVGLTDMPDPETGVNRLGSFMGVMGYSDLDMSGAPSKVEPGDLESAKLYGQRLAAIASKMAG
ncbi:MAG: flavodoxin family protein [Geitlerinemataceae cyanobacterium]